MAAARRFRKHTVKSGSNLVEDPCMGKLESVQASTLTASATSDNATVNPVDVFFNTYAQAGWDTVSSAVNLVEHNLLTGQYIRAGIKSMDRVIEMSIQGTHVDAVTAPPSLLEHSISAKSDSLQVFVCDNFNEDFALSTSANQQIGNLPWRVMKQDPDGMYRYRMQYKGGSYPGYMGTSLSLAPSVVLPMGTTQLQSMHQQYQGNPLTKLDPVRAMKALGVGPSRYMRLPCFKIVLPGVHAGSPANTKNYVTIIAEMYTKTRMTYAAVKMP